MELLKKLKYLKIKSVPMSDAILTDNKILRIRGRLLVDIDRAVKKSIVEITSSSGTNSMFQSA